MGSEKEGSFHAPELNAAAYRLWLEDRAKEEKKRQKSHFVTISREYGCYGFDVATKLCDQFNARHGTKWMVFTHNILEKLAEDEELAADLIHKVVETRYTFMNWFIDGLVPDYLQSVQSQVFTRIRTLILNLAERGNCIIVGGGSQIITGKLDPSKFTAVHARLYASFPFRVKAMMDKHRLSQADAEKQIWEHQDARNKFVEDFTGQSVTDPLHYNLILNNAKSDASLMAKTVYSYAEHSGFFK
jgi:cytidylate kinase